MSRINTNVTALISTRILNNNTTDLNTSLERLSTGLRINRGADDPAGLIASENLRKQITGTNTAIKNAERAINIIGTAEGALSEVSDMLIELQALLGEVANTGGMSTEEIDANQLQVDSILDSIDRIANNTSFKGKKLLNGTMGYVTQGVGNEIVGMNLTRARLAEGQQRSVTIQVASAAETGQLFYSSGAATIE